MGAIAIKGYLVSLPTLAITIPALTIKIEEAGFYYKK